MAKICLDSHIMAYSSKPHEHLLQLYNEVDAFLRQQYKRDQHADHGYLIQELARSNRIVARYQQELRAIARMRNSLVHNPFSALAEPLAEPNILIVNRYKEIRDALLNPHTALSIAIPAQKIYSVEPDARLDDVLKKMNDNIYTHVPIIENGQMVGVFSENTLLSYLADAGEAIITADMTMADFKDYLPLKAHKGEAFAFLPKKALLGDVFDVFNKAIHKHERIGMLFITEHGKDHEKPLGIMTAWDLASPEFNL